MIRKLILFLGTGSLIFLLSFNKKNVNQFLEYNKYSFVQYDLNNIKFPGDSLDFLGFFKKFDRLVLSGRGNVNIVHFGGSHIQADMWTGQIRKHFSTFLNQQTASRGLLFPYRAAKTNGSSQFEVTYNKSWEGFRNVKLHYPELMGVSGHKATAYDSGQYLHFRLIDDGYAKLMFERLKIFHDTGSHIFDFAIEIGDSIYQPEYDQKCQCSRIVTESPTDAFRLVVHKQDSLQTSFVLHGIQTEMEAPGLVYHAIGVNGAPVPAYLNCLNFEQQLAELNPDLIIFSIGINDAFSSDFSRPWFENNYNELIKRIKSTCPGTAILFTTNTDSYKTIRRRKYKNYTGHDVQVAMNNLAKKHGAAIWDMYEIMGGLGSISTWNRHGLAQRDYIHFTSEGYKYLGDLFFEAMIKKYEGFIKTELAGLSNE